MAIAQGAFCNACSCTCSGAVCSHGGEQCGLRPRRELGTLCRGCFEEQQKAARAALEHLRGVRENDPSTFDYLLGGQTQDPNLKMAFIQHANGKIYFRGLKPESEFTALERESAGMPRTEAQERELERRARRLGVVHV